MSDGLLNPRRVGLLIAMVVGFFMVLTTSTSLVETNNAGYYQVKQAAVSGSLSVRNDPGTYWQGFATIHTYQLSDEYYFSKHEGDGDGSGQDGPIKVRFNDGGTANISGAIKFRLSNSEKDQLLLHNDFKSFNSVKHALIRQVVTEAVQQTANIMKAEESYSTRRSQFAALAEEQVINGIYETVANVTKITDADSEGFVNTSVDLKLINGKPVVRKLSPLPRYHIEVLQFVIKDIDFDETIENLINKKKEAEQQRVVARANAERAKQDAITAREQGEAKIAVAKAEEEVKKIQAVVEAQKQYEVSKLSRQKAEQDSQASILQGKADAEINKLKVQAGLTPQEKAEYNMKTAIGVAERLSHLKFPEMMVLGGGGGASGHAMNPFDAVGLESFIRISEGLANKRQDKE